MMAEATQRLANVRGCFKIHRRSQQGSIPPCELRRRTTSSLICKHNEHQGLKAAPKRKSVAQLPLATSRS